MKVLLLDQAILGESLALYNSVILYLYPMYVAKSTLIALLQY